MELTSTEIHYIRRTLIARAEWIKDNFHNDDSIEEYEQEAIKSVLSKLDKLHFVVNSPKEQTEDFRETESKVDSSDGVELQNTALTPQPSAPADTKEEQIKSELYKGVNPQKKEQGGSSNED